MNDAQWKDFKSALPMLIRQVIEQAGDDRRNDIAAIAAARAASYVINPVCQEGLIGYMAGARKCFEDAGVDLGPALEGPVREPSEAMFAQVTSLYRLLGDHTFGCVATATRACLDLCEQEGLAPEDCHAALSDSCERQSYEFFIQVVPNLAEQIVQQEYVRLGVEFPAAVRGLRSEGGVTLYTHQSRALAEDLADAAIEGLEKFYEIKDEEPPARRTGGGDSIH